MMNLVLCTSGVDAASELADSLVSDRLAACVNIIPGIQSVYRWKGEVCRDAEALLVCKVSAACTRELVDAIRERHPYDTPEILVVPVDAQQSDARYLEWVLHACGRPT